MIGSKIGPYEVVAKLGEGGMGEVYRARDTQLNRDVAIKVLPAAVANDPERLSRFTREAQTLAALNHPNIAQVYGFDSDANALIMELVTGSDLSWLIARGPMKAHEAYTIARQIAAALEAAHASGIIHRDLKPANVKIRPDGTVKVLDFGLAKALDAHSVSGDDHLTMTSPAMTEAGVILGTAAYMSPEQARGKAVDQRSDIWAFGAVLYEMLCGRRVFHNHDDTVSDMVAAVLRDPIDWSALPKGTSAGITELLLRCLDRDLDRRIQTMTEVRSRLDEAAIRSETRSQRRGFTKRARWLAVTGVLLLVAGYLLWPKNGTTGALPPAGDSIEAVRSIAVMPFVNSSGSQDDDYFADGMTEELIGSLGRVPGLRVAARSSSFAFKGQKAEARDIAQRLGVDNILEGSVRRSGDRLRVTASLVNARDGLQLWTDTFESNGTDTFAIQDEVTRGVVKGLALQFSADALSATKAGRTSDPVAHDLYKRGLEAARMSNEYGLRRSLIYFQQAIDRDPRFALAHVGLAWSHVFLADAFVPPNEAYAKAKAAAEAALAIDDRLGEAHALVAYSTFTTDWSADATALTEREFRRGLDLDPNSFNTLFLDGTYRCFEGQTDRGISEVERAGRMDPLSPLAPYLQELCNYIAKRYEAVLEAHKKTLAVDPTFAYIDSWAGAAHRELRQYDAALKEYAVAEQGLGGAPQYGLALTYIRMGRTAEARAVLARMEELARTKYVPFILRAIVYANLGELGKAAELLQQGVDRRETVMLAFKSHPEMEPLQKDPRTRQILQRVDAMRGR